MADGTKIEWSDATWNPITGCSVHSAGCTNCYAMRYAGTRGQHLKSRAGLTKPSKAGPVWTGEVRFNEDWLTQPLKWREPRRIFVNAHGDTFHENVPDEWIDRIFAVMALCPQHQFQVLTKRSARMRDYLAPDANRSREREISAEAGAIVRKWNDDHLLDRNFERLDHSLGGCQDGLPLPNVWLGVSVEDQRAADERVPDLLATPAAVRWLSCEPLLGPVDLTPQADRTYRLLSHWYGPEAFDETGSQPERDRMAGYFPRVDWVVAGGESGPKARPMHPDWARSLRDQCAAADVPFLFKQWGEWAPGNAFGLSSDRPVSDRYGNVRDWMNRYVVCEDRADRLRGHSFTGHATDLVYLVGKKRAGRLLDGVLHDSYPVATAAEQVAA